MKHRFVRRTQQKTYPILLGAFDLETIGLGGEFAVAFTYADPYIKDSKPVPHFSIDAMFKTMLNPNRGLTKKGNKSTRSFIWIAHNGAKFDFTYMAIQLRNYAVDQGIQIETVQQGTKIIEMELKTDDGKIKIRDSFPLLNSTLEAASKVYAPYYAKGNHCPDHDFTKNDNIHFEVNCNACMEYAAQDVVALWHTYMNCRTTIIQTFGIAPAITMGATAMKAWLATITEGHVYYRQCPRKERFLRNFTTGAYITPGCTSRELTPEAEEIYAAITVDRSAAFAGAMLEGNYPTDNGAWVYGFDPEAAFAFYECEAYCPEDQFPVVPLTSKDGVKRWATGHGTAYVTSEQYQFCLDHGYTLKVIKGIAHDRVYDVFSEFIRKCENLEYPDNGEADPAIKELAKGMRNSLNGKFAIREIQNRLYIGMPSDGDLEQGCKQIHNEITGEVMPLFTKEEELEAPYCQPGWYAITVARQQMEELRLVGHLKPDERYKCDTDSVTMTPAAARRLIESGDIQLKTGYGFYKVEHKWLIHQSIGPKNYMGFEDVGGSKWNLEPGEAVKEIYRANCKGIPQKKLTTNEVFKDAHHRAAEGEKVQISFDSLRSMREMLASDYTMPGINRVRSIGMPDTVNGWNHNPETKKFSPIHF